MAAWDDGGAGAYNYYHLLHNTSFRGLSHMAENAGQSAAASTGIQINAPKLKTLHTIDVVLAAILVVAAIILAGGLIQANAQSESVHSRYNECTSAAAELMIASDYLTTECRMFVLTGDRTYMDNYFEELLQTRRRDAAVATLSSESGNEAAAAELVVALAESNELAMREFYAMRLVCEANNIEPMPNPIATTDLSAADAALAPSDKIVVAKDMVLGNQYQVMKKAIVNDVDDCATELVKGLEQSVFTLERQTDRLLMSLLAIAFLLMALVLFTAISNYVLVTRPMKKHEADLRAERPLADIGCYEIRRVVYAYNELLRRVNERTTFLRHEAETDALTGVFNRGSYDKILAEAQGDCALVLVDIDHFKEVNDQYGHEMGDEVLKRVANVISSCFRSSDYVCRIGGDEFAVILPDATPANKDAITVKLDRIAETVAKDVEGQPHVTVSFGVAFRGAQGVNNLYHDADRALYASKNNGRATYTFYGNK